MTPKQIVKRLEPFLTHGWTHIDGDCPKRQYPDGYRPEGGMFYEGPGYSIVTCTCGLDELLKEIGK